MLFTSASSPASLNKLHQIAWSMMTHHSDPAQRSDFSMNASQRLNAQFNHKITAAHGGRLSSQDQAATPCLLSACTTICSAAAAAAATKRLSGHI